MLSRFSILHIILEFLPKSITRVKFKAKSFETNKNYNFKFTAASRSYLGIIPIIRRSSNNSK